jgi:alpha-D-xyloside xylohydrolase
VVADAPVDRLPVWARAGAVIAKIPEDVMTLVPQKESGNTTVKSLDDRRVYELIGGEGSAETQITDFEGRAVARTAKSLKISGGPAARVTVRWRFGSVVSATVNGVAVPVQTGLDGPYVEFDHAAESLVEWQLGNM